MANRNGLGPNNKGPMTGRGLGTCKSEVKDRRDNISGFMARGFGGRGSRGRGFFEGQGRGMGRRNGGRHFFRQSPSDSSSFDSE